MKKVAKSADNKSIAGKSKKSARFDAVIPKDQKAFFIRAANIGGYRTLTEFVISSVKEKAEMVMKKHETLIATQQDQEIFFNAISKPAKPNLNLIKASKRYKKLISEQEF